MEPGRHADRDSFFLTADIVSSGDLRAERYRIRNLSKGGVMAQGGCVLALGTRVSVTIRNIGPVTGKVAWVEGDRYGIAFDQTIDPSAVRAPVALADFLADSLRLRPRREA